jgi:hypothetical protein
VDALTALPGELGSPQRSTERSVAELGATSDAVICVDGIVTSIFKPITPDISWEAYVSWLKERRPDLDVVWLSQPHDWLDILTRRALSYEELVERMVVETLAKMSSGWQRVVILGFSLGGLTALRVTAEVARLATGLDLEYVAYVTFGTPFAGTGRHRDALLKLMPFDYLGQIFDMEQNQRRLKELLLFAHQGRLRMLFGEIIGDEILRPESALLPLDWLTTWQPTGDWKADAFRIKNRGALIRNHDGLLYDSNSIAYIDGLVDGLLPCCDGVSYVPFELKRWRKYRPG